MTLTEEELAGLKECKEFFRPDQGSKLFWLLALVDRLVAENALLTSENEFLHMRRGQLAIERDEARTDRTRLDVELHNAMDEALKP